MTLQHIGCDATVALDSHRAVPTSGVEMPISPDAPRKIREKLAAGRLPRDAPPMTAAAAGTGNLCDGCDIPIHPDQMQYEFEAPDRRHIRLHVWCGLLWEAYRREGGESDV